MTWNVEGLSLRENNWGRLLRVLERVRMKEWEVVCVTELRAYSSEVLWWVEDGVTIGHPQDLAVVMRGEALRR